MRLATRPSALVSSVAAHVHHRAPVPKALPRQRPGHTYALPCQRDVVELLTAELGEAGPDVVESVRSTLLQGDGAEPQLIADVALLRRNVEALKGLVPRRSLGPLLSRCPELLTAQLDAWINFLQAFGFQRLAVTELLLNNPHVFLTSDVYHAGRVFTFLKGLGLRNEDLVGPVFKWRALLESPPGAVEAVAAFLADELQLPPATVARIATEYPTLFARSVAADLQPKHSFLASLGPGAQDVLYGMLWKDSCGYMHGVANWDFAVQPKLDFLASFMGQDAAMQLLRESPMLLKLPVATRLRPLLSYFREEIGLTDDDLRGLLVRCPQLAALATAELESRFTFLAEVVGVGAAAVLRQPSLLLQSLCNVLGPRYFYVNQCKFERHFPSGGGEGGGGCSLDLDALFGLGDEEFVRHLAQSTATEIIMVRGEYEEYQAQWHEVIGWCCDVAFTRRGRGSRKYEEALSLFSMLVQ